MPHPAHLTHVDRRQFFLTDCQWPSKWGFLPFIDNNAHSRKNSMMFYMPKYFCCLSTPFFSLCHTDILELSGDSFLICRLSGNSRFAFCDVNRRKRKLCLRKGSGAVWHGSFRRFQVSNGYPFGMVSVQWARQRKEIIKISLMLYLRNRNYICKSDVNIFKN